MTAPFDQDDEPTAMFVPSWDDDEDRAPAAVESDGAVDEPVEPADEPLDEPADEPREPRELVAEPAVPEPAVPAVPEAPDEAVEPTDDVAPEEDGGEAVEPPADTAPEEVEAEIDAVVVAAVPGHDETGPGTLRPVVPEPVVEARRARSAPAAVAPSPGRRAWEGLRSVVGLLVLVVCGGVGLAAAIGAVVLAIAFALQQAVGD